MPKARPQEAIVVLGGSFCPPHAGHIAALNQGRAECERDGLMVVAGYLAVAPNGHVQSKLRARGEEASLAFDAQDRMRMCNAAAETTSWIKPTTEPFGSAQACGTAMVAQNHAPTHTRVVTVRGHDAELLRTTKDGEAVSSALVRRELQDGGSPAIRRLVNSGTLLPSVAQIMEQLLMNTPAEAPPSGAAASSHEPPPVAHESSYGSKRVLASASAPAPASDAVAPPPRKRQQSWGAASLSHALPSTLPETEGRHGEHDMAAPLAATMSAHAAANVVEAGLHVFRAEWDAEGVYFYQAFPDEIAEWALREQCFGGPSFNAKRMTWIKPSFAWVLYRSGYARKHNQQRILKVKLPHALVAELLSACACKHGGGGSKGRVQWDPARDLMTSADRGREPRRMLRERAIQIGLSRELSERYVTGALSITDVSALGRHVGAAHGNKEEWQVKAAMTALLPQLPVERPYMPSCPEKELVRLGLAKAAGQTC